MPSDGQESYVENFAKISELNILLGGELGVAGLFPEICSRDNQCVLETAVCYVQKDRAYTKVCRLLLT